MASLFATADSSPPVDELTLLLVGELILRTYHHKDNRIPNRRITTMARAIHYPNDFEFRPFRNLPPVNLAQNIPPEEPATILLLDCRDPGSILHTIHHGFSNPRGCLAITIDCLTDHCILVNQILDFMCCDSEPATLGTCDTLKKSYTIILCVTASSAEHSPADAGDRRTARVSPLGHLLSFPNQSKSPFSSRITKPETI